ncbi:hypothetical protein J3B02_004492 [Coemansia erecta]|nr:hypothetical protein J3B02_004492 [Coemansia erecta]
MPYQPTVNQKRKDIEKLSSDGLRLAYASEASINPGLSVASIPPSIPALLQETEEQQGELIYMSVSQYQGILQGFFVGLLRAKRVLEIGTFTGSSAIFFANALKRNGVKGQDDANGNAPMIALELSEEYAKIARKNFVRAEVDSFIDVRVGDARENLTKLAGQKFEIVFIDADKNSYKHYYDTVIEMELLAENGLIIIDNTAFDWVTPYIRAPVPITKDVKPLDVPFSRPQWTREQGKVLHEFNEYVRNDPRTEVVMLPMFTGITLVRLV